ncbi:MAG: hypothetical protein CVU44_17560 [Chloroflexi bacterium HGW-Chloroflexi-6]|nr:MAG: hypothetical protein CVU44_17560 [Chloroflexi bacterium HGW-Chloroflexi-6]
MSQNLTHPEPVLTGARQTMLAWSKVIESYEEVPEIYRPFLNPILAASDHFPHIVLAPPLDKFLRKTNQKLICDSPDAIHILERSGSQVLKKSYPYQSVVMIEVGIILLNSWISVYGPTSEGQADHSTIEFNTTGERHYSVFLKKIRPDPEENGESSLKAERDKFDHLSGPNFKFMNYARSSLLTGETVLQTVLQPEIRQAAWKIFGWTFYRTVSLAHLAILTDKELILIRDDERAKELRGSRHGGVWQYIPLSSIRAVSVAETDNGLLELSIGLSSGDALKKTFAAASKPELEQLRNKLQDRIGK